MIQCFKNKFSRTWLSRAWHRYAPSFTVAKRFRGVRVFMDLRDNIDDVTRSRKELETRENGVLDIPIHIDGDIWDVGANVGLFTVSASLAGHRCIAFELSPKAHRLLEKTKSSNQLGFELSAQPLSIDPIQYRAPTSSNAENSLVFDPQGDLTSLTFREAVEKFGVPGLIKMDIEGGEIAFFESVEFKRFIQNHNTVWLVEIHANKIGHYPKWNDVPIWSFGGNHDLYCSDPELLDKLRKQMQESTAIPHG